MPQKWNHFRLKPFYNAINHLRFYENSFWKLSTIKSKTTYKRLLNEDNNDLEAKQLIAQYIAVEFGGDNDRRERI